MDDYTVEDASKKMKRELAKDDAYVDGIYFCPHHPDGVLPEYRMECRCRKPDIGLVENARSELDIDMERSYVIGDRWLDIEFAHNANLPRIPVLTGYDMGDIKYIVPHKKIKPIFVAKDLSRAARWALKRSNHSAVRDWIGPISSR